MRAERVNVTRITDEFEVELDIRSGDYYVTRFRRGYSFEPPVRVPDTVYDDPKALREFVYARLSV